MTKSFMMGIALLFSANSFAAVRARETIKISRAPITVAVIDTGADVHHRALKNAIWTNPGESGLDQFGRSKENNNIDDDGNGFVDDIHGWNFVDNNNDLQDQMGHGTHISGIISSESRRSSSSVKLMVLRYYKNDASDSENIENTVKAINYAVTMGAKIINYSGGGSLPNKAERTAIEKANSLGVIFVAAAGNNSKNTDIMNYYPANYGISNIISVAAADDKGDLTGFSNYGEKTVDIAAPGKHIFSTLPDNTYGFMSGTSQATAFVTGVIAQILSEKSKMATPDEALKIILSSGRYKQSLFKRTKFNVALLSNSTK